ncbi:hypothetical protein D3C87_1280180 [compost metagenome]
MQQRCNHRPCRTQPAECGEGDDGQRPAQTNDHVDLQRLSALATQAHAGPEASQVAADQHDVGGRQCNVRPASPHRHSDHTGLEGQGIVDAVADHHRPKTAVDFLEHAIEFVLGQRLRLNVADADIPREGLRHTVAVTGEQQLPAQSQLTQFAQGELRFRFDAVCE